MRSNPDACEAMTATWESAPPSVRLLRDPPCSRRPSGWTPSVPASSVLADPVLLDPTPARLQQERDASAYRARDGH